MGMVPGCREPAPSPSLTGVTGGCGQAGTFLSLRRSIRPSIRPIDPRTSDVGYCRGQISNGVETDQGMHRGTQGRIERRIERRGDGSNDVKTKINGHRGLQY